MTNENNIVDPQTTNPQDSQPQEQNKSGGEEGTPQETPNKASKNFEKLLKQRNQARKAEETAKTEAEKLAEENEMLKQQLNEKKEVSVPDNFEELLEQKLSEKLSTIDNEAKQKSELYSQFPEAREYASQIDELAKAHPSVPYEWLYSMINPSAFVSTPSNNKLDGATAKEQDQRSIEEKIMGMSDSEIMAFWDKGKNF